MIYYFSGTGNSQWVAEQIALRTKDKALYIPLVMRDLQTDINVGPNEVIGIVFPIYAWAPPEIVMQFLQHVHVDSKTYTYAIATCGTETGKAFDVLKQVFPFKSAYSVAMPDNYIPMYEIEPPELIREKLNVAQQLMPIIAMNVTSRGETIDIDEGSLASLKTKVVNPLFVLGAMKSSKFSVDKSCTGCGVCEKNCPFKTIKLVDGKPVWTGRCQQCMSCIMRCPVHAIQYGRATRNRKRYINPYATKLPSVYFKSQEPVVAPVSAATSVPVSMQTVVPDTKSSLSQASALWKKPVDMDTPVERSEATGGVELVEQKNIQVLQKNGVLSRQLLTPGNSKDSHATVTEVHLQIGAMQDRHVHESSEQIWYALRGTGTLLLANNEERQFRAGDVVRFSSNTVHGLKNDGTDEFIYVSVTMPPLDFTQAYAK
jgi:quercetin dioxygenase-like cupin family protein/ferredoxin